MLSWPLLDQLRGFADLSAGLVPGLVYASAEHRRTGAETAERLRKPRSAARGAPIASHEPRAQARRLRRKPPRLAMASQKAACAESATLRTERKAPGPVARQIALRVQASKARASRFLPCVSILLLRSQGSESCDRSCALGAWPFAG